jgi:hypothetical protein
MSNNALNYLKTLKLEIDNYSNLNSNKKKALSKLNRDNLLKGVEY